MTDRIYVKPADGFHMRDEFTMQPIPAEGYSSPKTSLVIRRLMTRVGTYADGKPMCELNECDPPKAVEPEQESKRKGADRADKVG